MRYIFVLAALSSIAAATPNPVAAPAPQGVTAAIYPTSTPSSCSPTYMNGDYFQIGLLNASSSSLAKRQVGPGQNPNALPGNILLLSLLSGHLTDARNRTGYIASNGQLQFDNPVQAGALYTAGFSACPNDTLALSSAVWYSCGSGSFANLYDRPLGDYCQDINLAMYLYTGDASSAIVGTSAATMTGPSATGVVAGVGSATTTTAAMTTAASGSVSESSASATGATGAATASRTMSTGTQTSTAAGEAVTTTAAAGANTAPVNSVGKLLSALVALIGFMAFKL